jgi:hypothetical protein
LVLPSSSGAAISWNTPLDILMDLAYLTSHWAAVRAALLESVDRLADSELDFQPYPDARTVRALLLHIAQEERGEFAYGIKLPLILGMLGKTGLDV